MTDEITDRVYGCLVGGAIGDALGAIVQGWSYEEIRETYGRVEDFTWYDTTLVPGNPGSVTGDTVVQHYLCLAVAEHGGRITPDELAEVWQDHLNPERVWVNGEMVLLKLQLGMNPWTTGRETFPTSEAVMGIAPVGIINAGDPRQAYQDGFNVSSLNQDGVSRDAGAAVAAGIAAGMVPGATVDDVLGTITDYATDTLFCAIDLTMDLTADSDSVDEFTERFYDDMLDWRRTLRWDKQHYYDGKLHSTTVLEIVPAMIAILDLCDGDPERSIVEAASFGRQADTIAGLVGNVVGAVHGASALRDDWIDTCEQANRDFFEEVEGTPDANFESMAHRLVDALENERQRSKRRTDTLTDVLEQ